MVKQSSKMRSVGPKSERHAKKTGDGANVPHKVTAEQQTPNQGLGLPWTGTTVEWFLPRTGQESVCHPDKRYINLV